LSGDRDLTAKLVSMYAWPLHWSGRISTLEQWIGWFDQDGIRERYPAVAVLAGFIFALDGRRHGAERWLTIAENTEDLGPLWDGSSCDAWVAMLRGMMSMAGPDGLAADTRIAVAGMRQDSPFMPGVRLLCAAASLLAGDLEEAQVRAHDSAQLSESRGAWPGFAVSVGMEASLALRAGHQRQARALTQQALDRLHEVGMTDYQLTCLLHAVAARVAVASGSKERARHHLGYVHRLRPLMTAALPWYSLLVRLESVTALIVLRDVAAARTLMREVDEILRHRPDLGSLGMDAADVRGRLTAIEEAGAAHWTLTAAELRVLQYLPTHLTFGEIAERLYVSPHTVKSQAVAIYGKLGVSSRRAAIETAVTYGLLDDSALRFPLGPGASTGIG
jgi:LuxR family maltose regulon positive regulatory protein